MMVILVICDDRFRNGGYMKNKFLISSLAVLAIIVSACASATPMAPTETMAPAIQATAMPTNVSATVASGNAATVDVGQNATLGSFLVDSKGMTLYLYTKDTPNTSNCYSTCATYWPPLLTTGSPTGGTGVTASMLGTAARTDGTTQVTYNGWPLYYYASDKAAGDTTGENVQGVWYVITPAGVQK
jgi:predicted lipoprotein with Yx(FWY)xxD motif